MGSIINIKNHDWVLNSAIICLIILGLVSLFSVSEPQFYKQIIWVFLGIVVFLIVSAIDYRALSARAAPSMFLYLVGVLGVSAVYFIGISARGSGRWIDVGLFWIEPVEPLKIALILILAKYFSGKSFDARRLRSLIVPLIYVLIPVILVFSHPDLGSLAVLLFIWTGILIVAGIKFRHFMTLAILGALASFITWTFFLYEYQRERVFAFLNPSMDPFGSSYNTIQSIIAISSGGWWGKGLGNGGQSQLGFLPEVSNDFIFAAIVEELGIVMGAVVLILFCVLVWRFIRIAINSGNNFARIAVAGVAIMISAQVIFNIGMTIGLMPVSGLTLPFLSYGGSSMVTVCAAAGFVQSVHRYTYKDYREAVFK